MRPLGFALVGAGAIGRVFADAVAATADAELRLVVARRPDPARELAATHGAAWSTDLDGYLAAADDVDVVIVATPSGTHADRAVPALEAGKHLLVEKPLDVSLAAADRIVEAERRTGNVVAVVSQHRFDRSAERVAAEVATGGLGRLTSATASCAWWRGQSYYDSGAWRGTWALDGGGAAMNQAVHIIDLLLSVMGTPEEVSAYTGTLAHERIEVEDTAVAVVRFVSGALATIHATTAAYPGVDSALRVYGDGGSAVIVDDELVFLHTTDGAAPEVRMAESGAAANQVTTADRLADDERGLGPAHVRQLEDLVAVVRARQRGDGSARPRVGTPEARTALALILGMYESARTGRPVRLDATPA
ncbi:Gfo/Idh/MocA family protein [Georgenia yuyongxinii]|uniref:Gfo/Idh/MocA family oxidoreductase n=1 Tax=Georgenia yuyongxinii TaxID=2589797 RepID=A0A552WTK4_9MICO|nr:Gfo/Idh/MocA family oxidoreductase [Georgenia yuyongxinii]TRW46181.1 Gfo/Idh/MocA family oxidoreductase [Georgenia yuyongxinii]